MRTTYFQFQTLVDYMERYGDFTRRTSSSAGRLWMHYHWAEVARLLNSNEHGDIGPSRTAQQWKKVWADFKNNTRRRAKLNIIKKVTQRRRGSYCHSLEARVLAIINKEAKLMDGATETGEAEDEESKQLASKSAKVVEIDSAEKISSDDEDSKDTKTDYSIQNYSTNKRKNNSYKTKTITNERNSRQINVQKNNAYTIPNTVLKNTLLQRPEDTAGNNWFNIENNSEMQKYLTAKKPETYIPKNNTEKNYMHTAVYEWLNNTMQNIGDQNMGLNNNTSNLTPNAKESLLPIENNEATKRMLPNTGQRINKISSFLQDNLQKNKSAHKPIQNNINTSNLNENAIDVRPRTENNEKVQIYNDVGNDKHSYDENADRCRRPPESDTDDTVPNKKRRVYTMPNETKRDTRQFQRKIDLQKLELEKNRIQLKIKTMETFGKFIDLMDKCYRNILIPWDIGM